MDIFLSDNEFHLPDVPCNIVYDIKESTSVSLEITPYRCGLKFNSLNEGQENKLEFFSITIQPGKCRRAEFRSQNSEDRGRTCPKRSRHARHREAQPRLSRGGRACEAGGGQRTEVRGNRKEEIEKRKQDSEFRIKKLTNKKNNLPPQRNRLRIPQGRQTHTDTHRPRLRNALPDRVEPIIFFAEFLLDKKMQRN